MIKVIAMLVLGMVTVIALLLFAIITMLHGFLLVTLLGVPHAAPQN